MKLITEISDSVKYITEDNKTGKNYMIEGIFLQGDIKNRNGRIYPSKILENEVDRYVKEYVSQNRAFGELGHPDNPQVNLDRVSHMIKSLKKEGSDYIGRAKIMDTPYGKIVKSLIDEGAKLGVSSRGVGTLSERDGANVVNDDFQLSTAADIVADPSAPSAFVRGIMENCEWVYVDGQGWIQKFIDTSRKNMRKMSVKQIEEQKIKLFENFLDQLSKKHKI